MKRRFKRVRPVGFAAVVLLLALLAIFGGQPDTARADTVRLAGSAWAGGIRG